MPLAAGTRFGPYEILASIGAGGMGEVYRARDTRLDRIVAIKILLSGVAAREEVGQRFEREARAVSSLNHPHICSLYDIGRQDGVDFLVMEYIEGETLSARIKKGALPLDQSLNYAIQIAGALDQAHRHAVVHRDLKPGNIMITRSGAKLLDFGLAKISESAAAVGAGNTALPTQTALTREGTILGTFQYMSPEQLEGAEADARTDVFAFGATLYEMLTGRKAFEGKSQASLISAIMTAQPQPLTKLQPLATPALEHVVAKCLAKDPEDRWQSARDLEVELKWIGAGGGVTETAVTSTRFRKREQLAWIISASLFVALIAAVAMVYFRPVPEARAVQFQITLPENVTFNDLSSPSVSPDGQSVAISAVSDGQPRIWIHAVNSLATNPLPGTEGGIWPFWSPDSREIGFTTGSVLKKVSLKGGAPQTICNLAAFGSAWNHDGVILFWPGRNEPLYRVSAMGGEPKAQTKLDPSRQEIGHVFPSFLPDGRHFTYLSNGGRPTMYMASLDSPDVKRISDGNTNAMYAGGQLLFMRDQSLMAQRFDVRKAELSGDPMLVADPVAVPASIPIGDFGDFTVSENGVLAYRPGSGRTQLVWFDRSGKRLKALGEQANYSNPSLSPDQKRVAVSMSDPQTNTRDIWVIDVERSTSSRFTFNPGDESNPTWSPDSKRIAFWSDRKGHRNVYVKVASGAGDDQLVWRSNEDNNVDDWSSDGQYLFAGDGGEWLFSFREGKARSFVRAQFRHEQYRFCPNGNAPPSWFAYESAETGASQVYVRSFAGTLSGSGGKWQISTDGGSEPYWRHDGKELFYLNSNKLMAVEVNGAGVSFQAGNPKMLFEAPLTPAILKNRYDVSSDGKRFLLNVLAERQAASFTVVLNWPGLLKR